MLFFHIISSGYGKYNVVCLQPLIVHRGIVTVQHGYCNGNRPVDFLRIRTDAHLDEELCFADTGFCWCLRTAQYIVPCFISCQFYTGSHDSVRQSDIGVIIGNRRRPDADSACVSLNHIVQFHLNAFRFCCPIIDFWCCSLNHRCNDPLRNRYRNISGRLVIRSVRRFHP